MSNKILVVDDETEIADLIEVYLKNENYTVFKFYTAQEALIGMLALRPPQRCMKKGCAWRNIWQKGRRNNEKIENRCFVWRLFPGV